MPSIRLSDLSPQAQQQALGLLGVPKRVRRIPPPFTEPPPLTDRQQEIQAVRRALSLVAAQITEGRLEWAIERIEAELQALRVATAQEAPGSPQSEQLVLG